MTFQCHFGFWDGEAAVIFMENFCNTVPCIAPLKLCISVYCMSSQFKDHVETAKLQLQYSKPQQSCIVHTPCFVAVLYIKQLQDKINPAIVMFVAAQHGCHLCSYAEAAAA